VERKRVVVTGMGIISPLGNNVAEAWKNVAAGVSGIDFLQRIDTSRIDNKIGGEVKDFDAEAIFGKKDVRRMDRFTHFALYAAAQAIEDSKLEVTPDNQYEIGCIIGSGIGGLQTLVDCALSFEARGQKGISPLAIPSLLIDSPSSRISIKYGVRGPNYNITTACATGNNCIGEAAEKIRLGTVKAMVVGSSEAGFVHMAISGFDNMTTLTGRQDDPKHASRPFDKTRDGFVMGEGAAVFVLEELEHAKARGATIYAEILGYGHTSDAYHVTAPMDTGEGAAHAMKFALRDAGLKTTDIDYINAHGTGTPLNDKSETLAVKKAFGEHAYNIPMSSTKSMTGHMLGAAGSVEALFSIMAIREKFIPPTTNYETPDPECDLNYTPNVGVKADVKTVMSNSFGFGGHNAVIIIGEYKNGHHGA